MSNQSLEGKETMRTNKVALLGIAVLALTLAAGCAKPPQVEIDATKASLSQVEADASRYAMPGGTVVTPCITG